MARPIAETPILFGEDAERFAYEMDHVVPVPKEELDRYEESYAWLKSIADFEI